MDEYYYYIAPNGDTAYTTPNQPVPVAASGTPMTRASKAEYDAQQARNATDRIAAIPCEKLNSPGLVLKVDRSPLRVAPADLQGNYLDEGRQYAVYITDGPWIGAHFSLDGVLTNEPTSAPWDAFGTAPDGTAVRQVFAAGAHSIEAVVSAEGCSRTITATFEVE
jgi:hypothetical protein